MAVLMQGTVLTVQYQEQEITVGRLRAISEIKLDSDMVDVTPLNAPGAFRQYEKGLRQAGDVTLSGFLSKDESSQTVLRTLYLGNDGAQFTITYPDGEQIRFDGLVKALSMGGGEVDSVAAFTAVVRITGAVSFL